MKQKMRRPTAVLLAFLLTMSLWTTAVSAEGTTGAVQPNLSISCSSTVYQDGGTLTVTISNKAMTMATYTGGVEFDKDKMTCTKVEAVDGEPLEEGSSPYFDGGDYQTQYSQIELIPLKVSGQKDTYETLLHSTVSQSNSTGRVGFALIRTADVATPERDILKITFQVKADQVKVGDTVSFSMYEDSSNAAGTVKVNFDSKDPENAGVDIGQNTATVSDMLLGDVNEDQKVNSKDVTRLRQNLKNPTKYPLSNNAMKAADVNRDDKVNSKDITRLRQYLKNPTKYPI